MLAIVGRAAKDQVGRVPRCAAVAGVINRKHVQIAPPDRVGHPQIFVSHGVRDQVLPIDRCSRPLVESLREGGYTVEYREFDGGHEMPEVIVRAAFMWATSA